MADMGLEQMPDRLEVGRQRGQGAQVDTAFMGAVEVRAPGGGQAELARHVGVFGIFMREMAAGDHFDALPAVGNELGEQGVLERGVEPVAPRVGDDRNAAGIAYPAHAVAQVAQRCGT